MDTSKWLFNLLTILSWRLCCRTYICIFSGQSLAAANAYANYAYNGGSSTGLDQYFQYQNAAATTAYPTSDQWMFGGKMG